MSRIFGVLLIFGFAYAVLWPRVDGDLKDSLGTTVNGISDVVSESLPEETNNRISEAQEALGDRLPESTGQRIDEFGVALVTGADEAFSQAGIDLPDPADFQSGGGQDEVAVPVDYNRDDWRHWDNHERSCWTVREEVLFQESLIDPVLLDRDGNRTADTNEACSVSSGLWWDVFSGDGEGPQEDTQWSAVLDGQIGSHFFTNPSDLDVDHLVPLAEAHASGGSAWDTEKKRDFANHLGDADHLIAVWGSSNRSKSKFPPSTAAVASPGTRSGGGWVPPNTDSHCWYAQSWKDVKSAWDLEVSEDEQIALDAMLATC